MVAGRPKKYNDVLTTKSIMLPAGILAMIDDFRSERGLNFNEYVVYALSSVDKNILIDTIDKMKQLEEAISNSINQNSQLIKQINSVKNIKAGLFESIEPDPNVSKFIKIHKERILKMFDNGVNTNNIVEIIYREFENHIIKQGSYVRRVNMTKLLIKQEILKIMENNK